MNKILLPVFIIIVFISACSKKGNVSPSNNTASLLTGSWLVVKEHDRFYTTPNMLFSTLPVNTLVEDTTINITEKKYQSSQIFNKNGTYFIVDYYSLPILDTLAVAHYSISNQIINYTYDKSGLIGQHTILKISDTNLTLEDTFDVTPTPGETQGLPTGDYKCVSDTYYIKQ